MTGAPQGPDLEREVRDELRLVESSHPDEAIREPVVDWRFDPTDVPRYDAVLHSLLGAVEALDEASHRDGSASA